MTKAAGDVAQAIGGDVKQTEAELLSRVLGKIDQSSTNLRYYYDYAFTLNI